MLQSRWNLPYLPPSPKTGILLWFIFQIHYKKPSNKKNQEAQIKIGDVQQRRNDEWRKETLSWLNSVSKGWDTMQKRTWKEKQPDKKSLVTSSSISPTKGSQFSQTDFIHTPFCCQILTMQCKMLVIHSLEIENQVRIYLDPLFQIEEWWCWEDLDLSIEDSSLMLW